MAKLTKDQIGAKIEREIKRQNALEAKKQIKEQKRDEDINFYRNKYKSLIGDEYTPKLTDLIDLDDFFIKIERQLDEQGQPLKNDYNKFIDFEEKRKEKEKEINKDLDEEIGIVIGRKPIKGKAEKIINGKRKGFLDKYFKKYKTYFNDFTPKYNKYICSCCGGIKAIEDFPFSGSIANGSRIDKDFEIHHSICKNCFKKIFDSHYLDECNKDPKKAMEMTCVDGNIYWDEIIFESARINYEKNNRFLHITQEYFGQLGREDLSYLTYWDSPIIREGEGDHKKSKSNISLEDKKEDLEKINNEVDYSSDEGDILHRWNKVDSDNRRTVIKMVGYDPFEYESEENRKNLYEDLLGILDLGMENDFVKLQAAIQIVQSFFRVRQMDKEYVEKLKEKNDPKNKDKNIFKDLKELSDLKSKELKTITDFAKDNGFSERFAAAKAKGEGTLSGIMNKMANVNYESAIVNRYDIETSESIQQAANASFKAIFSQLSLGEADVWKICQNQLEELKTLRDEKSRLKEENRILHCEIKKEELIEKAHEAGVEMEEELND